MDTDELLIEEYKVKWQYLFHLENLQSRVIQWYFAISGTLLAIAFDAPSRIFQSQSVVPASGTEAIVVLVFLVLYALFVSGYMLMQKQGYNIYYSRVMEIEEQVGIASRIPPVESRSAGAGQIRIVTSFRLRYGSVVLTASASVAALASLVFEHIVTAIIVSFIMFIVLMGLSFLHRFSRLPGAEDAT